MVDEEEEEVQVEVEAEEEYEEEREQQAGCGGRRCVGGGGGYWRKCAGGDWHYNLIGASGRLQEHPAKDPRWRHEVSYGHTRYHIYHSRASAGPQRPGSPTRPRPRRGFKINLSVWGGVAVVPPGCSSRSNPPQQPKPFSRPMTRSRSCTGTGLPGSRSASWRSVLIVARPAPSRTVGVLGVADPVGATRGQPAKRKNRRFQLLRLRQELEETYPRDACARQSGQP